MWGRPRSRGRRRSGVRTCDRHSGRRARRRVGASRRSAAWRASSSPDGSAHTASRTLGRGRWSRPGPDRGGDSSQHRDPDDGVGVDQRAVEGGGTHDEGCPEEGAGYHARPRTKSARLPMAKASAPILRKRASRGRPMPAQIAPSTAHAKAQTIQAKARPMNRFTSKSLPRPGRGAGPRWPAGSTTAAPRESPTYGRRCRGGRRGRGGRSGCRGRRSRRRPGTCGGGSCDGLRRGAPARPSSRQPAPRAVGDGR